MAPGAVVLTLTVYLSAVGLGLMALPREVANAFLLPGNPAQRIAKVTGAVDGGVASEGWWMNLQLAAPGVVNLGAMSVIWDKSNSIGIRLGVLNTTAPLLCDGTSHVLLQMDSLVGDYSARISKLGAQSNAQAARVEYVCSAPPVVLPRPLGG